MKLLYVSKNLDPNRCEWFTYNDAARELGIRASTLRNHASKERWKDEVQALVQKRSAAATVEVQKNYLSTEIEIRRLQAKIARAMYMLAAREMKVYRDNKTPIPVKLIERWVCTGLTQERAALGMAKTFAKVEVPEEALPQKRLKRHQENLRLLADFFEYLDLDDEDAE